MLLRHYIDINPMISHKLFEYICNLLKSIYQLSWVIKTSIICRPMCLCVFRILLFLTPMFYAVAKQIWHMIDGQNLNYVHGQTIQRFRQWYDWTVSGIFTFNLRMPWGSSNKKVKKSFFEHYWNNITTWYVVPYYTISIILRLYIISRRYWIAGIKKHL